MRSKWYGFLFVIINCCVSYAQELNCIVTVNAESVAQTNSQIFSSLQTSMRDFMNNTKFTPYNFSRTELIDCHITFNVTIYDNNTFTCNLLVGSIRPVYNSSYNSPFFALCERLFSFS